MSPNTIGNARGKEGIFRRGQPLAENFATVLAGGNRGCRSAEELGRHRPSTNRMPHIAATAVIDDHLAIVLTRFAAHLSEKRREAVVIVHRPAIERMVVALGTLRADTAEDLGDILGRLEGVALDVEISGRRIFERSATRG